jgi:intracellular septation protein A
VDLCSIGTLFAFILVCGGVLVLQNKPEIHRKFKVPYINGKYIIPLIFLVFIITSYIYNREWLQSHMNPVNNPDAVPMLVFFAVFAVLSVVSFTGNLSLIPVMGILTCTYLMAQINLKNWIGFLIWLVAGLLIYFGYSYKNSRLNSQQN